MSTSVVKLHVYDLSKGLASSLSGQILGKNIGGIWHTGIVAFGKEWYWSGVITSDVPGATQYGVPVRVVELGETNVTEDEFMNFIKSIDKDYTFDTYNILSNNCNNFTQEVSLFLTSNSIPDDISLLPQTFLSTALGKSLASSINQVNDEMKHRAMIERGFKPSKFPITNQYKPSPEAPNMVQTLLGNIAAEIFSISKPVQKDVVTPSTIEEDLMKLKSLSDQDSNIDSSLQPD